MNRLMHHLPNTLTIFRMLAIPLILGVFYVPESWLSLFQKNLIATALFTVAGLTDWLDGYLARRLNTSSSFGEFLDPVADKLLVCSTLIALVDMDRLHAVLALIIIGREITISALREWMGRQKIKVSALGKWKTTAQMVGIGFLLYAQPLLSINASTILSIGFWLIIIAVVLTLISMVDYLHHAYRTLSDSPSSKSP